MALRGIDPQDRLTISFEFFPPRSEKGFSTLFDRIAEFENLEPSYVSVTYGAGGTTRTNTHNLVIRLLKETSLTPVPHLTCIGHSAEEIDSILERYATAGVRNLLALRGDPPADPPADWTPDGDFPHAADLVRHIRKFGDRHGHDFGIGVAGFPEGHPDTPNSLTRMAHLKAKVDSGADWICTQLFFNNHAFHDWRDRARLEGITVPIHAGVMPITSRESVKRMAELAAGTVFPAPLMKALSRCDDDPESVAEVGVHWATEQCRDLLDHDVDGVHFYTLNQTNATSRIHRALGVKSSRSLRTAQ